MNCLRKSARLLAYVKTKFTEMPSVHCTGLSEESCIILLTHTTGEIVGMLVTNMVPLHNSSFSPGSIEISSIQQFTQAAKSMRTTLDFDRNLVLET